jgi:hypothetical protein
MATTPVVPAGHVSWLKRVGAAIYTGLKDVVGLLSSSKVQTAEAQLANVAEMLLPAEAPMIQAFQTIMGKIFQQSVVSETLLTNVAKAGTQKLAAVVAGIEPELDQWVTNNFPGAATVNKDLKEGLVTAIVNFQNGIMVAAAPTPTPPAA